MEGYVYIGFDQASRYFKIGKSINPKRRTKEIKNMNPTFDMLICFPVEDQDVFERQLHIKFSNRRIVGEWFDLSSKEISELTNGWLSVDDVNMKTYRKNSGYPYCPECGDVTKGVYDATTPQDVRYFCDRCDKMYKAEPNTGFLCEEEG